MVPVVKGKFMNIFKTNRTKNYREPTSVIIAHGGWKNLRKPKIKKQLEDKILKATKERIIRDIKNLFEQQEEDYYKPVGVGSFYSNNYFEDESNCDKN